MPNPNRAMDVEEWKLLLQEGRAPVNVALHKDVDTEVRALDVKTRQVRFRITTGAVDRMKDTIDPKGWDLKNWKANPVFLWAHQYGQTAGGSGLPIAKGVDIAADAKGLTAVAQFATKEQYAFADTVYQLILGGFLKATSVGFKPQKHVYNEQRGGVDFLEQELLEVSVVPIPANPEALVESKAIDLRPMRQWLELQRDSGIVLVAEPEAYYELATETVDVDLAVFAQAYAQVYRGKLEAEIGRLRGDPDYCLSRPVGRGRR